MTRSTLRTLFAIFSVLIMCTTAFFSMSGEVFGLINPIPDNGIGYGDLIVEPGDNLVYQSKSLEHDGNIIIQNTGRFVLDGTYLNIKAISPGEYRIEVQSGGILEIIGNSRIGVTDGGTYSIIFKEGSIGFIDNSILKDLGDVDGNGIIIYSSDVTISSSRLDGIGTIIKTQGASPLIIGNTITGGTTGIYSKDASNQINKVNSNLDSKSVFIPYEGGVNKDVFLQIPRSANILSASMTLTGDSKTSHSITHTTDSDFLTGIANDLTIANDNVRLSNVRNYLIYDNFDNEVVGSNPSQWTVTDNDIRSFVDVTNTISFSPDKSVFFKDTAKGKKPMMERTFDPSGTEIVEFVARTAQENEKFTMQLKHNNIPIVQLQFNNDGMIQYKENAWISIMPYQKETWYNFKIVLTQPDGTFSLFIDENQYPSTTLRLDNVPLMDHARIPNTIIFGSSLGARSKLTGAWIDDVHVYRDEFMPSGSLESTTLTNSGQNIKSVIVNWNAEMNGQYLTVKVSNDDGLNYYEVQNGIEYNFPEYSNQLRYLIELSTSNPIISPILHDITIAYQVERIPSSPQLDIGDDGDSEFILNGDLDGSVVLTGQSIVDELNQHIMESEGSTAIIPLVLSAYSDIELTISNVNIIFTPIAITNNIINKCNLGLQVETSSMQLIKNIIQDNYFGIEVKDSNIDLEDSIISNNSFNDITGEFNSHITLINTKFGKSHVTILDTSELTVYWHLDILLLDQLNKPASGMEIFISDNQNNLIYSKTSDINGRIPELTLEEYKQDSTGKIFISPYFIETNSIEPPQSNVRLALESTKFITIHIGGDSDFDGLSDDQEHIQNIWSVEAEDISGDVLDLKIDPAASGGLSLSGMDNILDSTIFSNIPAGTYRLYIKASEASDSKMLSYTIFDKNDNSLISWNGPLSKDTLYHWYPSKEFSFVESNDIGIRIAGEINRQISIDKFILVQYKTGNGEPTGIKQGQLTDPFDPDTDDDGALDGREVRQDTYWFEAEDYNPPEIATDADANGGQAARLYNGETITIDGTTPADGANAYLVNSKIEGTPQGIKTIYSKSNSDLRSVSWKTNGDGGLAVGKNGLVVEFNSDLSDFNELTTNEWKDTTFVGGLIVPANSLIAGDDLSLSQVQDVHFKTSTADFMDPDFVLGPGISLDASIADPPGGGTGAFILLPGMPTADVTSPIYDLGLKPTSFNEVYWYKDLPTQTSLTFNFRSGDSKEDIASAVWQILPNENPSTTNYRAFNHQGIGASHRYIQWQVCLVRLNPMTNTNTPILFAVGIIYSHYPVGLTGSYKSPILSIPDGIKSVRVDFSTDINDGTIKTWISNDNINFIQASNGDNINFLTIGNKLIYMIEISTFNPEITPVFHDISFKCNVAITYYDVAWKPDNTEALIVGENGVLLSYNPGTSTFTHYRILDVFGNPVILRGVAWPSSGTYAVAVGSGGTIVRYLSIAGGGGLVNSIHVSRLEYAEFRDVDWRPDDSYSLIVGTQGSILTYYYDMVTATDHTTIISLAGPDLNGVDWSPDKDPNTVAYDGDAYIVGIDGTLIEFRPSTGTIVPILTNTNVIFWDIEWNKINNYALIVGYPLSLDAADTSTIFRLDFQDYLVLLDNVNGGYGIDWKSDGSQALIVGHDIVGDSGAIQQFIPYPELQISILVNGNVISENSFFLNNLFRWYTTDEIDISGDQPTVQIKAIISALDADVKVLVDNIGVTRQRKPAGILWSSPAGPAIDSSSPAIHNGYIIIGSTNGMIYAFNATRGSLEWSYQTNGAIYSSPMIFSNIVYIGSDDGNLYALDLDGQQDGNDGVTTESPANIAANGDLLWSYQTGGAIKSSPAIYKDMIFIGSNDNYLYVLDATPSDGVDEGIQDAPNSIFDLLWYYNTNEEITSSPVVENNTLIITTNPLFVQVDSNGNEVILKHVFALEANPFDGTDEGYPDGNVEDSGQYDLIWYFKSTSIPSSPAMADGIVFVGDNSGNLFALPREDPNNDGEIISSEILWQKKLESPLISSPIVAKNKIVIGAGDSVYAIDEETGAIDWKYLADDSIISSPAVAGNIVIIGSIDKYLYALDLDGKTNGNQGDKENDASSIADLLWKYNVNEQMDSSPILADINGDGHIEIVIGTSSGNVKAFDGAGSTVPWAEPWPCYRLNPAHTGSAQRQVLFYPTDPMNLDTDSDQIPDGYEFDSYLLSDRIELEDYVRARNSQDFQTTETLTASKITNIMNPYVGLEFQTSEPGIYLLTLTGTTIAKMGGMDQDEVLTYEELNNIILFSAKVAVRREIGTLILPDIPPIKEERFFHFIYVEQNKGTSEFDVSKYWQYSGTFELGQGRHFIDISVNTSSMTILPARVLVLSLSMNYLTIERLERQVLNPDIDKDSLKDGEEIAFGAAPLNPDADKDGLSDPLEKFYGTNPLYRDTDFDGLRDRIELGLSGPSDRFTIWDTAPSQSSAFERNARGLGNNPNQKISNSDGDKGRMKTDPLNKDSDNDGLPDGAIDDWSFDFQKDTWGEYNTGTNCKPDFWEGEDRNLDGSTDLGNWNNGLGPGETDPTISDSDGDDLPDSWEGWYLLDPLDPLGINGKFGDKDIYKTFTSPWAVQPGDIGGPGPDGLTNYNEYIAGTMPIVADTDQDFALDGQEVQGVIFRTNVPNGGWSIDNYGTINAKGDYEWVWFNGQEYGYSGTKDVIIPDVPGRLGIQLERDQIKNIAVIRVFGQKDFIYHDGGTNEVLVAHFNPINGKYGWSAKVYSHPLSQNKAPNNFVPMVEYRKMEVYTLDPRSPNSDGYFTDIGIFYYPEDRDGLEPQFNVDSDGDGVANARDIDSDNDLIQDRHEATARPGGFSRDTDNDGKPDILDTDSDSDGVTDTVEFFESGQLKGGPSFSFGMMAYSYDVDNDGLLDWLSLTVAPDSAQAVLFDSTSMVKNVNADGTVTFLGEANLGSNNLNPDTDNDGLWDGNDRSLQGNPYWPGHHAGEVTAGTDRLNPDYDYDGVSDGNEYLGWTYYITDMDGNRSAKHGSSNPNNWQTPGPRADSDLDGIPDNIEFGHTDGYNKDSDGDGINDGDEDKNHDGKFDPETETDPTAVDTDKDHLPDGWIDFNENQIAELGEYEDVNCDGWYEIGETNPKTADTDGDSVNDGLETRVVRFRTNAIDGDYNENGVWIVIDVGETKSIVMWYSKDEDVPGTAILADFKSPEGNALYYKSDKAWVKDDGGQYALFDKKLVAPHGEVPVTTIYSTQAFFNREVGVQLSDPLNKNSDNDQLDDGQEIYQMMDINHTSLKFLDPDGDGKTTPMDSDADGDGIHDELDIIEIIIVNNENVEQPTWYIDTDGDSKPNALDSDSDNDGTPDGQDVNPLGNDMDHDGLEDYQEDVDKDRIVDVGETNFNDPDSDHDGIKDGDEKGWNTDLDGDGLINALDPDSDGDGLLDGANQTITSDKTNYKIFADENVYYIQLDETTRLFVGEHGYGTDPYNPDTDLDGLWDGYTPTGNPPYTGDVIIGFQTVYIENGKVLTPNENLDLTDYYFKIHGELTTKTCATKSDTDGDGISDGAEINGYYLYDYVWPKDHFKGQEGEPGIGASNLPLDNALFVLEPNGYIEVPIIPEPAVAGMKYYAIQFTASACCAYNLAPTSTFEVKAYDKNDNELASFSKTISLTFRNIEQNEYPYQGFDTNNDNRMDTFYYHANLYLGSTDEETILKISNIGGSDKIAIYGPIMILRQGLNPLSKDTDSDHINDNIELQKNPMTSPINPDTDHDYITDSNDKSPVEYDIDNDGLGWPLEIHYGTDPLNFDSDYDYLLDGEEIHTGTKPLVADSDGDTIPDGVELGRGGYTQKTSLITTRNDLCHFLAAMVPPDDKQNKICGIPLVLVLAGHENLRMEWAKPYITSYVVTSDPLLPNTDYDGLNDLQELQQGTDPNIQDSDGDGWIDGPEESAIVNNEGPEISVSFFKSAGSNTVKISVVVWSYKNVDSVELWKSPYDDGTLLDYRYWQNLHRVTFDYDYILTTAEKLRGPTFDVYSTDTKGFERLDSFKYSGGAFDQIENYISKADALTFGPIKGGGDAGGLTAWDDMLSGTVDFIEKIGSGKNLEAIEKLGNMFQTKGLGAFQSMADGVSSVQENQNPFKDGSTDSAYPRCLVCKGLTENQAHDQFAYSWYAGYIIGMIATFMVTAESGGESIFGSTGATVKASTAIAGFEAASENLVTAKDISTQAASWSAKVTAFARNNMGRLIMLSLMVGTSITLKLIWPNIFENGFTAIFGAVFIVEMAINIKDIVKNAEEILLNMIRLCIKSPKMIFSMEKIGNLFKQFQLSEDERLSFWKYADTVMDLEKGEPSELVKLIKSYKIKGNILDPEIPNQEYKLVRFVKFNKLQNPLIINGEKFTDMAPLLEGSEARRFGWEHVEYVHIDGNRMRVGDTRFPTSYTKPQIKNMIEEGLFDENTIPDRSDSQAYWIFPDRYGYSDISAVKVIINDDVGITTFYPEKGCGGLIYDGQNWVPNVP